MKTTLQQIRFALPPFFLFLPPLVALLLVPASVVLAQQDKILRPDPPPLSPQEEKATIHVPEGYVVELVAAEPLVADPVAVAWDARGRLWVAEMADYPLGIDNRGTPGGRIRVLEDTDGDGRYDRSTVFLEGVAFPGGVLPWGSGALVTAAPEIFYAEDTDGDGRADRRQVWFTGFLAGNQQLRVNGLRRGLDNWIYCASGAHHAKYNAASRIRCLRTGQLVPLGSRDFRFDPRTGRLDPLAGPAQFGRNRDPWGNWFGQQNSYPLWHYVLEDTYLRRNPHFAPPDPRRQLILPPNPKVFPAKQPQKRYHSFEQSGRFTSACSATIYRDELLFPSTTWDGKPVMFGFTCEPFHNLVQRYEIVEQGVSFRARRADDGPVDFFASRDRWCRPVMVRTGPDGALWVVDMYRYMIEHPQFLTPQGRKELAPYYRSGQGRGRIWRVYRRRAPPRRMPDLTRLSPAELVHVLESPNGPLRDLAQELLLQRGSQDAVLHLQHLLARSKSPLARVHALWTLQGLGALQPQQVQQALADPHPGVRRQGLRLAEPLALKHPQVLQAALALEKDPHAKVRLQLLCSLGQWPSPEAARTLGRMLLQTRADPFLRAAGFSSLNEKNLPGVIRQVFRDPQADQAPDLLADLLAQAIAWGQEATVRDALAELLGPSNQAPLRLRLLAVAAAQEAAWARGKELWQLFPPQEPQTKKLRLQVEQLTQQARKLLQQEPADVHLGAVAVRLLLWQKEHRREDWQRLARLLQPQVPLPVQQAAMAHLGKQNDDQVARLLLDAWRGFGPRMRREAFSVLASRPGWTLKLLKAIEQGTVARSDLDAAMRQQLRLSPHAQVKKRAAKLLAAPTSSQRREVLRRYQAALRLAGSAKRGREVFKKHCSACHRLDGVGYDLGPNLRSLSDRRPETLLRSILDPNASVDGKYVTYLAITDDGRVFTGMMASESGSSITLVNQENKRTTILRNRLEALQSTGKSLMPEGLEKELSPQDVADLIAYIRREEGK